MLRQCFSVLIVFIPNNHSEFVSANPEDGTVLKCFADQTTGNFQVLIAFIMAVLVVDFFEVIAVENADSEFDRLFLFYLLLHVLDIFIECAFVSNRCKRVHKDFSVQIADFTLFLPGFPFRLDVSQQENQDHQQNYGYYCHDKESARR